MSFLYDFLDSVHYLRKNEEARKLKMRFGPVSNGKNIPSLIESARLAKVAQADAGGTYQATGEWTSIIKNNTSFNQEFESMKLNTMFRDFGNTVISSEFSARGLDRLSIKGAVKKAIILRGVHHDLKVWRSVVGGPLSDLAAPDIGSPWGADIDGTLIYPGVCRADYFASHVARLLNNTDGNVVAEIGGGYGEFAYRLMRRRPTTKYLCFDLPEVILKSSYFLMNAFPEKRVLLYDQLKPITTEVIDAYDIILMPNFALPSLADLSVDLLINTRSLSEMSRPTIEEYLRHVFRVTRRYFVHENSNEAVPTFDDHIELPASQFPIDPSFAKVYAQKSPWFAGNGRYVEHLYERR